MLQRRQNWLQLSRNLQVGDVVLLMDENCKRGRWFKAVVTRTFPDRDGVVRNVQVRTASSYYARNVQKLCLLEVSN